MASSTAPAPELRSRVVPRSASSRRMGRLSDSMSAVNSVMPSSRALSARPVQQRLADPPSLPGLEDGDRDLRAVTSFSARARSGRRSRCWRCLDRPPATPRDPGGRLRSGSGAQTRSAVRAGSRTSIVAVEPLGRGRGRAGLRLYPARFRSGSWRRARAAGAHADSAGTRGAPASSARRSRTVRCDYPSSPPRRAGRSGRDGRTRTRV